MNLFDRLMTWLYKPFAWLISYAIQENSNDYTKEVYDYDL